MNKKNKAAREAFAKLGKRKCGVTYIRRFPCTVPDWKFEQKRLTSDETMMVTWFNLMADSMEYSLSEILKDRMSMIPKGWMRLRQATGIMARIADDIEATMIPGQLLTLETMRRQGQLKIELQNASKRQDMEAFVKCDELQTIARAAQYGECSICLKEGGEIRGCGLRKAFDACGLCSEQYDECLGCHYRNKSIDIDCITVK